jgi:DNA uptake protein ComE-like DNA-binding protein
VNVQAQSGYPLAQPPGRLRGKGWLLFAVVPFGFTTWVAFLYIGIRARRAQWLAWSAFYAAMLAAYLMLVAVGGKGSAAASAGAVIGILAWIGGGGHAVAISDQAVRQIRTRADPALVAARMRIERRAEGRRLAATQPALAREAGVGRPDIAGADSYYLVDVNHASAAALASLPGISAEVASEIAVKRAQVGGFSSAEDLGAVLDLPPDVVERIRDLVVCIAI